jgi:hypothetical protein
MIGALALTLTDGHDDSQDDHGYTFHGSLLNISHCENKKKGKTSEEILPSAN